MADLTIDNLKTASFKPSKIIKWFLLSLFSLLIIIMGLISWVYYSEAGLKWALEKTQNYLPEQLSFSQINGQLSDKLIINQAQWLEEDLNIQAETISLECQWLDFLFKQINCNQVTVAKVDITTNNNQSQNSLNHPVELPDLAEFSLPISLQINSIKIDQINLINKNQDNSTTNSNPNTQFSSIQLDRFRYSLSTFVWKNLSMDVDNIKLQIAGSFKPDALWQHQLKLTTRGEDFNFELSTKGAINQKSDFKLISHNPIQLEANGQWFWKKGLYLDQTNLKASKQIINLADQTIELDSLQSQLKLNWPQLESDSNFKLNWQQFKEVEIKSKSITTDINNWQLFSSLELIANGGLSEKLVKNSIKELLAESADISNNNSNNTSNDLSPSNTLDPTSQLPVEISLMVSIENNKLTFNSNKLILGELAAQFDGTLNLTSSGYDSLIMSSEVKATSLTNLVGFPFKDLSSKSIINYQNNHWTIATHGSLGAVFHPEIALKDFQWDIKLNDIWRGSIKAQSINLNGATMTSPLLLLEGNDKKHQLSLISNFSLQGFENYLAGRSIKSKTNQIKLELSGQFDSNNQYPTWKVKNLKANIPFENYNFLLNAEKISLNSQQQSVDNLCIQTLIHTENILTNEQNGNICLSAKQKENSYDARFNLNHLAIKPLFNLSKKFHNLDLFSIEGIIDGNAEVSGTFTQLEKLSVNFKLPELTINYADSQTSWKNLALNGINNNHNFKVNIDWQEHFSLIKGLNWQSNIQTPEGFLSLNIDSKNNLQFDYIQQKINLQLPYSTNNTSRKTFSLNQFKIQGQINHDKIATNINLQLADEDHLIANIESDWPLVASSKINGDWDILISQLDWLKEWQPNIDNLDLNLQQKATFKGSLEKPQIKGDGKLIINQLTIDELGLDISNSFINIISENQNISINSILKNQAGELKLTGNAELFPQLTATLKIIGNQLTLIDNQEQQVIISPDVSAQYLNNLLSVNGKIILDKANIKIASLPQQAIKVSDDQKIIGQPDIKEDALKYNIQLGLLTGTDVKVEGFGLTSNIEGQLNAQIQNSKPVTLNGRLNLIDGKFEAYKQKLTIDQGQLLFLGPIDNPGIQFKATRKIDEITAGVIADGSISDPRLTLYSIPAMPEEKILALLLTGRSIESLSQSEGNALANAAIGLGVEGANMLAQKIGSALGIKNMEISSKTKANSTRVDIGAQINDSLTVGYGTSIDSTNQMQAGWVIEYEFSPSISFEATSGEEVSASINFKKQISSLSEEKPSN